MAMRKLLRVGLVVALLTAGSGVSVQARSRNSGGAIQDAIYKALAQFTKQQFERRGYVCAPAPSWMPGYFQYLWYLATCARVAR
jgi:hypothetical protein